MSVSSPCEICATGSVEYTCDRCGRLVCERHYDEEVGLCVECSDDFSGGRPDNIPSEEDMPDGTDTYQF
jgi:ribosomal protein L37AE/L43A